MARRLGALTGLIQELRTIWNSEPDMEKRMRQGKAALERTLADPELLAHSRAWPTTSGKNLLLYEDPDHHFAINSTVRVPGTRGTVHDHAHSWTMYGILDGTEQLERYKRLDDGSRAGHAELNLVSDTTIGRGMIDFVAPYEIHAERGGPARSVAIIVRSERLVGRTMQQGFDPEAQTVRDMWGPPQVPFDVEAAG